MREEQIGNCRLILGDCLSVLPTLGKVDAIVCDPPYEKEAHTMGRRVNTGASRGGPNDALRSEILSFPAITEEIRLRSTKWMADNCHGWSLCFCQAEAIAAWRDAFEEAGAKYKRSMVWIKPDGMPQYNGQMPGMGYESIAAAWCGAGHSKWNGGGRHGVFTFPKGEGHGPNLHETQKPVKLMRELVMLFSQSNDTVLDPFMGSGTTGVACVKLGRKFVGIEVSEKYFDIACRRIEQAYKQPDMFIEPQTKPVQGALII